MRNRIYRNGTTSQPMQIAGAKKKAAQAKMTCLHNADHERKVSKFFF